MAISLLAIEQKFCIKIANSNGARVIARCVDSECGWRVSAYSILDSGYLEIRKFNPIHSCSAKSRNRYVEKATSKVVAKLLHSKLANGKLGLRACDIPDVVLSELKFPISYAKAWNAKMVATATAVREEEGKLRELATYFKLLTQTNPGTVTEVLATVHEAGNHQLKFVFFAIGAAVYGWQYVRRIICLHLTQLKEKDDCFLVSACCEDGNFQILPLAFGIVHYEDEHSWVLFFGNLAKIVADDVNLVFVSDGNATLTAAVKQVYPRSTHVLCVVELCHIVQHRFDRGGLAAMVTNTAKSYTKTEFRKWLGQIEVNSADCAKYLKQIGFPYWARSHCQGQRFNLMSRIISESFKDTLCKVVGYPVISLFELLRTFMMVWFKERRDVGEKIWSNCTPTVEAMLVNSLRLSSDMKALAAEQYIYQVNSGEGVSYTVNLSDQTCTCNAFQALMIPCSHALSAIAVKKDDIYAYVDNHYSTERWREIYASIIMPVPDHVCYDANDQSNANLSKRGTPRRQVEAGKKKVRLVQQ